MKIFSIETGNFKCDGGAMFSVVPKALWSKRYPSDENNLCNCAMRSMLVDDGERVILIDNGSGDKQGEDFFKHQHLNGDATLESSLKDAGYSFEDITDVVFTHLHFDHCGGAVRKNPENGALELTFPNANYWVSQTQWENYQNPNIREKDSYFEENVMPIYNAGKLNFVEKEGELFPGFSVRMFNGHTPGLMVPIISNGEQSLVFLADFIPTTVNLPVKWLASYDLYPTESMKEKQSFLEEAVSNDYILFFQHDIYNECCSLKQTERGVKVDKTFKLEELKAFVGQA